MKATGVVRRIDDLGRIVLPKELRRTMRIKEGESLEIYTDGDNKIVLKKYSPVNQMTDFVKEFTESMSTTNKRNIIITDNEKIVAASGDFKVDLTGKKSGRGAYICKSEACLDKIIKSKRLEKAFEQEISSEIYESLRGVIIGK